jgi:hypothetical protein
MKKYLQNLVCTTALSGLYMMSGCHFPQPQQQKPQPIIYGTLTIPMEHIMQATDDSEDPLTVKNIRLLREAMNDSSLGFLLNNGKKEGKTLERMMEMLPKEWRKQVSEEVMKAKAREFFYIIRDAVEDKLHEVLSSYKEGN